MYFLDFILSGTALVATLIISIIPLQNEIYHKETNQYTKEGKWFMIFSIIAIVSWLTTPFRLYQETQQHSENTQIEKAAIEKEMDSVKNVLQKIQELKKQDSIQNVGSRENPKESLEVGNKLDSINIKTKDSALSKLADSLHAQTGKKTKAKIIQKNKTASEKKTPSSESESNVTNEKELDEDEKMILMNSLEQARKRYSVKSNCVELGVNEGSHPGDFLPNLRTFLKNKGYEIKDKNLGLVVTPFYGVVITVNKEKCFSIKIGDLSKTPIIFKVQ